MTKANIIRWILDLCVVLMLGYVSWSVKQFTQLATNDLIQSSQIQNVAKSVDKLDNTLHQLNLSLSDQNEQLRSLVILATFRTDPWSGRMMQAYHNGWIDWVKKIDPDFVMHNGPDVYEIQQELKGQLVPDSLKR